MRAGAAEEQSVGAVLINANRRVTLTESDVFSQSISILGANPMRGERRFNNGKRLDCCRTVCKDNIENSWQTWENRRCQS
jgi:deoxycytidylate deaminase